MKRIGDLCGYDDKLCFGSENSHIHMAVGMFQSFGDVAKKLEVDPISSKNMDKIMWKNSARLWKIDPKVQVKKEADRGGDYDRRRDRDAMHLIEKDAGRHNETYAIRGGGACRCVYRRQRARRSLARKFVGDWRLAEHTADHLAFYRRGRRANPEVDDWLTINSDGFETGRQALARRVADFSFCLG